MTRAALRLRDGGEVTDTVNLDRLTPRARALAEVLHTGGRHRPPVILESDRTLRQLGAAGSWYADADLDRPHRIVWERWPAYPAGSTVDPTEYLDRLAHDNLPIGYTPVGVDAQHRVTATAAAQADADLINRRQVIEVLSRLGRPISVRTLDNYRSKPPADWPQPVTYVGRTPLWSRVAIETYAKLQHPWT